MKSKKLKSFVSISIISLVIGIIGQFYTNYKIDQILSNFPYQLDNKFKISITEKNSDFFTRELIFNLEQNNQRTDFIHTKLTALPAIISAESQLTPTLVKKLNQQLNITIDQNTITNQFLVFNENFTSRILTTFRDGTNKSHNLESELTYSTKDGNIELQTDLSGFNYEKLVEIKDLKGYFRLEPISEKSYDIKIADLKTKKIDINLLDGDNTHIGIVKAEYGLTKKNSDNTYNLEHSFKSSGIYLSNKMTKSDEDKTRFENFNLSGKQINIPTKTDLFNRTELTKTNNLDLNNFAQYIANILFNNQETHIKISFDSFIQPSLIDLIELDKAKLSLIFNNQDKENSNHQYNLTLDNFRLLDKNQNKLLIKLHGLSSHYQISQLELTKNIDFLIQYIPTNVNRDKLSENYKKNFINALKNLSSNYKTRSDNQIKIKSLFIEDIANVANINISYQKKPSNNKLELISNIELDKVTLQNQQVQFNKTKLNFPLNLSTNNQFYQLYSCMLPIYDLVCTYYLGKANVTDMNHKFFRNLSGEINNANLATYISIKDKLLPVEFNLTMNTNKSLINIFKDPKAKIQFKASLSDELIAQAKPETDFWQAFSSFLIDFPLIKDQQDNKYEFEFRYENGKNWINEN